MIKNKRNAINLITTCIFIILLANNLHALPVRFDLVSGVDINGNSFSGYMDFEQSDGLIGINGTIIYTIVGFSFETSDVNISGDSGSLTFMRPFSEDTVFPPGAFLCFNNVSISTTTQDFFYSIFHNDSSPVYFDGDITGALQNYSTLPQIITVDTEMFYNMYYYDSEWNFDVGYLIFERHTKMAPVPEPATILLLSSGLLGFVWRKKNLKR